MRPETPQNRSQYHRLRRIIAMVRDGMAGGRLPNRSDFRRELEVSSRTLARDLDFLRDEERAPIAYEPARHGYRLTDATYDLPPVNLSRREVFSFSLARKMLHAFEGTPLEMDMRSTLDKIAGSLEGTFAVSLDALTEHMSVQAEDRVVIDPAVWEAMARAIERQDILAIGHFLYQRVMESNIVLWGYGYTLSFRNCRTKLWLPKISIAYYNYSVVGKRSIRCV
jgi:predicted DNA-binding transcriptional regulator YafY